VARLRFELVAAALGVASVASGTAASASADSASSEPPRIAWKPEWPRFRTSEAILTGVMVLPIVGALFLYPEPGDNFRGGVLFDDAVRDALVLDTRSARDRAASLSAPPYWGMLAFPLLVDTAIVTAGIHGAHDVALEMLAINLEAFAISGGLALTFQKLGRVRPSERGCLEDPDYADKCDNPVDLNQSFLSGHTAIAMTGAGLTCAHHRHLPLYGGGWPDVAICVATLAFASSTGVLRILSDDHYASDVLLGMGLGLASGWGVPEWLHYGAGNGSGEGERRSGSLLPTFVGGGWSALIAPQIGGGTLGLTLLARH
jgi:hypothetical protein